MTLGVGGIGYGNDIAVMLGDNQKKSVRTAKEKESNSKSWVDRVSGENGPG